MTALRYTIVSVGIVIGLTLSLSLASSGSALDSRIPRHDFLFVLGSDCLHRTRMDVQDGQLQVHLVSEGKDTCIVPSQLFRVNSRTGAAKIVSREEAQNLILDPNPESPDGFRVVNRARRRQAQIGSRRGSEISTLQPGVLFEEPAVRGYHNARFLGWIIE